ncbi:helix-turn-helix domain-containing protein [Noviherbaspirillum sedimenti]|nr:helix-turn-helix domain-containing protein [Noviherbaspirillum sedimenti]
MNEMKLAAGKRRRLRNQLRHTSDARQFRRLLAVLEYDRGEPVSSIAELLGVSRQSVYNWIERACRHGDPGDLLDAPRTGRPAKAGEAFDTVLRVLLILPPQRFGYHAHCWTVPLLRDQLKRNFGEEYSASTVRRGLQRLDYVWKRPRYVLVPDPEREKKTRNSARSEKNAKAWRLAG